MLWDLLIKHTFLLFCVFFYYWLLYKKEIYWIEIFQIQDVMFVFISSSSGKTAVPSASFVPLQSFLSWIGVAVNSFTNEGLYIDFSQIVHVILFKNQINSTSFLMLWITVWIQEPQFTVEIGTNGGTEEEWIPVSLQSAVSTKR